MNAHVFLAMLVGTLCATVAVAAAESAPAGRGFTKVVAFGDSITRGYAVPDGAGWTELLQKQLAAKSVTVFNAGGNGNTSAEGLKRIDGDVLSHMPGLVLVEFGGNDSVNTSRAVSVDDFERNLIAIHEKVRSKGGEIVLVTFPPIINEWHSTRKDPYYEKWGGIDQCVEQYRKKTREVAKRLKCPLFDLDEFLRKQIAAKDKETYINRDGVHLTPEANKLIAPAIEKFLMDNGKLAVDAKGRAAKK